MMMMPQQTTTTSYQTTSQGSLQMIDSSKAEEDPYLEKRKQMLEALIGN